MWIRKELVDIQLGRADDTFGWMHGSASGRPGGPASECRGTRGGEDVHEAATGTATLARLLWDRAAASPDDVAYRHEVGAARTLGQRGCHRGPTCAGSSSRSRRGWSGWTWGRVTGSRC